MYRSRSDTLRVRCTVTTFRLKMMPLTYIRYTTIVATKGARIGMQVLAAKSSSEICTVYHNSSPISSTGCTLELGRKSLLQSCVSDLKLICKLHN
jgi:hypothetical protein